MALATSDKPFAGGTSPLERVTGQVSPLDKGFAGLDNLAGAFGERSAGEERLASCASRHAGASTPSAASAISAWWAHFARFTALGAKARAGP
jgi:hypothetical protein